MKLTDKELADFLTEPGWTDWDRRPFVELAQYRERTRKLRDIFYAGPQRKEQNPGEAQAIRDVLELLDDKE